jgi:hypothetical protein
MISNDVIHVRVEGGKESNAESIGTPKADDYMCAVHDVGVMLNMFLLCKRDHNQDKEHTNATYGMDRHLV